VKFHLVQYGAVGRPHEIEEGMAGRRSDLFQRYLDEIRYYVSYADELGFAGYSHNEHHLQIEGFEESNHPGMMSLFVGQHSKRLTVGTLGYVLPTHNPVRVAEEVATLDHMLKGRLLVAFLRGYQERWTNTYAAIKGITATSPVLSKAHDERDDRNREIFEESFDVVMKALTSTTFSHRGKYWSLPPDNIVVPHPAYRDWGQGVRSDGLVEEIGIAPAPFQDPHPKIYGGFTGSMRTTKFFARKGAKVIVPANNLDFCEILWNVYQEEARDHGREVSREDAAAWGGALIVRDTREQAEEDAKAFDFITKKWFEPMGQKPTEAIIGTPDDVTAKIEEAHERLGFNECWLIFMQGLLPPEIVGEHMRLFAEKVMPRFSEPNAEGVFV
jgi:alkanesulfonate monooxygenase SsuD/methylene tetrahydromethanopterin reductase-like flavin-dependent oxidoreductase (luciferase family)